MKRIVSAALLMTCLLTGCGDVGAAAAGSTHAASQNGLYAAQTAKETHELRPQLMETQTVCLWAREQLPEELQATYDLLDHTAAFMGRSRCRWRPPRRRSAGACQRFGSTIRSILV